MMEALGTVLIGLLLRLGIPLLLTGIAVYLLRKLDARWQKDSQVSETEATNLFPTIRCWVLNDCPRERMEQCSAYIESGKPCWQVFRSKNGGLHEKCLGCEVFRAAPVTLQI